MSLKAGILIPTFNRAAYLDQAISSALAQTYEPLEVVVSDNGSTDETPAVVRKYLGDPRFRCHRNEKNMGLAANWRELLYELSMADHVMILADDDYLTDRELIAKGMGLAARGVRAVFAGGRLLVVPTGRWMKEDFDIPTVLSPEWWLDHYATRRKGKLIFPAVVSAALFDRRAAVEFRAFQDPVFGTDIELGLQFMLSGPTGYVQGEGFALRDHSGNDGKTSSIEVVLTSLDLFERMRVFGRDRGLPEKRVAALCRRLLGYLAHCYIVQAWIQRHGLTPRSWGGLYRRLARVDPALARSVAMNPVPVMRVLLNRTSFLYGTARWIYRAINRLRPSGGADASGMR